LLHLSLVEILQEGNEPGGQALDLPDDAYVGNTKGHAAATMQTILPGTDRNAKD